MNIHKFFNNNYVQVYKLKKHIHIILKFIMVSNENFTSIPMIIFRIKIINPVLLSFNIKLLYSNKIY